MRIAIVNDLAMATEILRRLVASAPGHAVAWTAVNGEEAVRKASADCPDLILMDLVMPVMDGVEATRKIMQQSPCPILLVTSSVTSNFNQVYRAMGCGALDAVNTPTLGPDQTIREGEALLGRIDKIARARQAERTLAPAAALPARAAFVPAPSRPALRPILALGASTGGPEALAQILKVLPADLGAAVLICQHIAADFAPSLARWLSEQCALGVQVVKDSAEPKPGQVLLACTDDHMMLTKDRSLVYTHEPSASPFRPSVDVLFGSLATAWPRPGVAVLLTGMGTDGAQGLLALRKAGWHTIAQDEKTSVVYGMPKAAANLNAACEILPLGQIPARVLSELRKLLY